MKKKAIYTLTASLALLLSSYAGAYTISGEQNDLSAVIENAPAAESAEEAPLETVNVKINGSAPFFKYAPLLVNDSTYVPLRTVMEFLNASVSWDEPTETITIKTADRTILMTIGSYDMTVSGKVIPLPHPPYLIGEVTYVPLRAISESLGAVVGWEDSTFTASIYTYETTHALHVGERAAYIGQTVGELTATCGEPTYTVLGENGLLWYVYNESAETYFAVGVDAGLVGAFYSCAPNFSVSDGFSSGTEHFADGKEYEMVKSGNITLHKYYDTIDKTLSAVYAVADGFENVCDMTEALAGESRMGLDILNVFRATKHLPSLEWNVNAAMCSRDHAAYMASVGELTHTGADGSTGIMRYKAYDPDFRWSSWGENICMGAKNIFTAMNGWRNSMQHRSLMLSDKTDCGIGMVYDPLSEYRYSAAMLMIK